MTALQDKTIILGVTGGIAAYKSADLTRRLMDHGARVHVAMTPAACEFVTPVTFQALSGNPVHTETVNYSVSDSMAHIHLTREADAIIIAPASADFMAKLAHGMADDLLSTLCLARPEGCPLAVVPAMNREMWANPATQRNRGILETDGIKLFGPAAGQQACGEVGAGRMLEPLEIVEECQGLFSPKRMKDLRVLITAGPTQEAIDPVRVITNISSGKTGYAIAKAARRAGAKVSLISGTRALPDPYGIETVHIKSVRQMHQAVMQQAPESDIFISVAAVADWYVANFSEHKIKKSDGEPFSNLEFKTNPDILAEVAAMKNGPWCVGFAAETQSLHQNADEKRRRKHIDLLVGNIVQDVMGKDDTQLVLYSDAGHKTIPSGSKSSVAEKLIDAIMQHYQNRIHRDI